MWHQPLLFWLGTNNPSSTQTLIHTLGHQPLLFILRTKYHSPTQTTIIIKIKTPIQTQVTLWIQLWDFKYLHPIPRPFEIPHVATTCPSPHTNHSSPWFVVQHISWACSNAKMSLLCFASTLPTLVPLVNLLMCLIRPLVITSLGSLLHASVCNSCVCQALSWLTFLATCLTN